MEELKVKYDIISGYCDGFSDVRTVVDENGITWYCANDICLIMGYDKNNRNNITRRYCSNIKQFPIPTLKGVTNCNPLSDNKNMQKTNFINKEDVYNLLSHSKMPRADEFRHWLFGDVLPTIEVTGAYILDEAKEEYKEDPKSFEERYNKAVVTIRNLRELAEKKDNIINDLNCENATLNSKLDDYEYLNNSPTFKEKVGRLNEFIDELEQTIDEKNAAHHMLRQLGYFHPETVTQFSKPLIKMN